MENSKTSTLKIVLIVLAVLVFGTLGTCVTCMGVGAAAVGEAAVEMDKERAEAKVELQATLEDCKKDDVVEWATLARELKENEARAAAMWKNSCAKVSGVVDRVVSGIGDEAHVIIGSGQKFEFNNLRCRPIDQSKALNLSKGQQITVWGIGGGEMIGSLVLKHCDW